MQVEACIYFTRAALQSPNKCTIIILLLLGCVLQVRDKGDYIMGTEEYIKEIIRLCKKINDQRILFEIYSIVKRIVEQQ